MNLVPSKPPSSINAKGHVSLTTIPVSWQPVDPQHINGVLLGYKIRYQAVAFGQEPAEDQPVLEKNVSTSALTVVLENLDIFTLYRVDVLGYTVIGEGPEATDYAGLLQLNTYRSYAKFAWQESVIAQEPRTINSKRIRNNEKYTLRLGDI